MNSTFAPGLNAIDDARAALRELLPLAGSPAAQVTVAVRTAAGRAVRVKLPQEAYQALVAVLGELAGGEGVTVSRARTEMTTQQAAEFLGVSRPYLVALLDRGEIPHRKVGTHRRVLVSDVLAFRARDDARRDEVLDELAAEAQRLGLGY